MKDELIKEINDKKKEIVSRNKRFKRVFGIIVLVNLAQTFLIPISLLITTSSLTLLTMVACLCLIERPDSKTSDKIRVIIKYFNEALYTEDLEKELKDLEKELEMINGKEEKDLSFFKSDDLDNTSINNNKTKIQKEVYYKDEEGYEKEVKGISLSKKIKKNK